MNGQMQDFKNMSYEEYLKIMPEPISNPPKIKMNLAGLSHYAVEKGVSIEKLSKEEIRMFVPNYR